MKDIRKTLYLGLGLGVKLLAGLFAVKLCAQYLGPDGFGLTGQLSSILSVVSLLAGAGVSVGITKVYAGSEYSPSSRQAWIAAARWIAILSACLVSSSILLTSGWTVDHLFQEAAHAWWLIGALALSTIPIAFAGVGQGKINGSHRDDLYSLSLVAGSVLGLIGLWACSSYLGPTGALLGMIWLPVAQAIVMSLFGWKIGTQQAAVGATDREFKSKIRFLLSYGALTIVAGAIMPVVYIIIRLLIQEHNGNEVFGLWQATLRISEAYCQLPMLLLTVVLFSRFAGGASSPLEYPKTLKTYIFMLLMMAGISAFVYLTRSLWIDIVFTSKFRNMEAFVPWQLAGDTLRILSYLATTILAARGKVKLCIWAEVIQGALLLLSSVVLIPEFERYGVYYAYIGSYFIYFLLTVFFLFRFNRTGSVERAICNVEQNF